MYHAQLCTWRRRIYDSVNCEALWAVLQERYHLPTKLVCIMKHSTKTLRDCTLRILQSYLRPTIIHCELRGFVGSILQERYTPTNVAMHNESTPPIRYNTRLYKLMVESHEFPGKNGVRTYTARRYMYSCQHCSTCSLTPSYACMHMALSNTRKMG